MTCGDIKYWAKCLDGHAYPIREQCKKWSCPDCKPKLVAKQALRAAERLEFAKPHYGELYHYVVSFKKVEARSKAIRVAKRLGLDGGSIVEHRKPGRSGNHFHIIAFGRLRIQDVADYYRRTNTTVKRIRLAKNVFKVHRYELGHAYLPHGQVLAYWGVVSNRVLGFEDTGDVVHEASLCPKCKKQQFKAFEREDPILPCYNEELWFKRKHKVLKWKDLYKQKTIT